MFIFLPTSDISFVFVPECDTLKLDGYKVDLNCATIPGNGLNCNVSCPEGLMVLEDVPVGGYICNNATGYQWNTTEFPRCSSNCLFFVREYYNDLFKFSRNHLCIHVL